MLRISLQWTIPPQPPIPVVGSFGRTSKQLLRKPLQGTLPPQPRIPATKGPATFGDLSCCCNHGFQLGRTSSNQLLISLFAVACMLNISCTSTADMSGGVI
ncbi:hypothetical protein CLOM_g5137 [Closterium sp. NIES-68]|nr:hypothetical protein CLOM_g5137 [Closterium sp. NIES-68]GJP79619.1 hypothetical protein CLOP_g9828 [Closterium sp. NIES-67]